MYSTEKTSHSVVMCEEQMELQWSQMVLQLDLKLASGRWLEVAMENKKTKIKIKKEKQSVLIILFFTCYDF